MIHLFLLTILLGDNIVSNDMYFYDINRCNYFASKVVMRYGNYKNLSFVPKEHQATAYCTPKYVNPKNVPVYR